MIGKSIQLRILHGIAVSNMARLCPISHVITSGNKEASLDTSISRIFCTKSDVVMTRGRQSNKGEQCWLTLVKHRNSRRNTEIS